MIALGNSRELDSYDNAIKVKFAMIRGVERILMLLSYDTNESVKVIPILRIRSDEVVGE